MGCFSSKPTPPPSPSRPSRPTKRPPHKPPPPRISTPSAVQRSPSLPPSPSSVAPAPTASENIITYQTQEPPSESPSPRRRRVSNSPTKRSSTGSITASGYKHYSTPSPDATDSSPSYEYSRPSAAETKQSDNRPSRSDTKKSNSRTPTPPSTRTRAPSSISQRTPILLYEKDSAPTLHRREGPSHGVHKMSEQSQTSYSQQVRQPTFLTHQTVLDQTDSQRRTFVCKLARACL
ncbi:hypothetical protein QBC37DRAFT_446144 [Rhypophila decipiens]|uniref:Uncharacterized protein n=1 Tax=Rhypophila decipiens TaxID=261697 RepID=A0AAN6Y2L0_9PEZI|nr:hypothetical protein QBC37DRAFT_446144 [Rhypophila decipiens]